MLKAHILLLATIAILQPIPVSANQSYQDYTPIKVSSYSSFASDYTTMQTYYTGFSLPLIKQTQEQQRLAEEKIRQEQELEKIRQAEIAALAKKQVQKITPVIMQNFEGFNYEGFIRERCEQLGCNANQVIRVMYCESGGRANAVNRGGSGASGLFQFMPGTFNGYARRLGMTGANIWNPRDQIIIATYMFANGGAGQWSCK